MAFRFLAGLSLASALYVALSPRINTPLYRNLLFYPERFPPDFKAPPKLEGVDGEDVFFEGSMRQRLNGWFFEKSNSQYVILFSHGNSGNLLVRENLAQLMLQAGYSVFVYDYQGFGRSSGKPTVDGICSDGLSAYDYLVKERGFKPENILLYGESLGAAVAAYISSQRGCSGLILQSGFASLRRIACETFPFFRLYPHSLFPMPPLDSLSTLKSTKLPLLIIHGDLDATIPVQHSVDMYQAAAGSKKFLRLTDTAHGDIFHTAKEQFVEALAAFPASFAGGFSAVS